MSDVSMSALSDDICSDFLMLLAWLLSMVRVDVW